MEEGQEEQQQVHRGVVDGIARLTDPRYRKERHKLIVTASSELHVDRHSLQHLVNFLDNHQSHEQVVITELELHYVRLSEPLDGGYSVLRDFFARSNTTLTKIMLNFCHLGSTQEATDLLAAYQMNQTVVDLSICGIHNVEGAALGHSLSGLMQNMPQLRWLVCYQCLMWVDGVRALQPALQVNRTLQELGLRCCYFQNKGTRLLADSLVGNTAIEILDIGHNGITSNGLDDITRLLELTRLKAINLSMNATIFGDAASTRRFACILSRHELLKELNISYCQLENTGISLIVDTLVGNPILEALDMSRNIGMTFVGLADIR